MKFNLKSQKSSSNLNAKLQKDYSNVANYTTQKQLDDYRVDLEYESLIEDLLEDKRYNKPSNILEKMLEDSVGGLHKHRNKEAYTGDINVLEKKRMDKKNKNKGKTSSEYSESKRWWKDLVANNSSRKKVISQTKEEVDELDFSDKSRWDRIKDTVTEDQKADYQDFDLDVMDEINDHSEKNDITDDYLQLKEIRPVNSPIAKGLFVSFLITKDYYDDVKFREQIKELAYKKLYEINPRVNYLNVTAEDFDIEGDTVVARLIGEDYYYLFKDKDVNEKNEEANQTFSVVSVEPSSVESVYIGNIKIDMDSIDFVEELSDKDLKKQILDLINDYDDGLIVEQDGIDTSKIQSGYIKFIGQKFKNDEISDVESSSIFDIVVLSESKKK